MQYLESGQAVYDSTDIPACIGREFVHCQLSVTLTMQCHKKGNFSTSFVLEVMFRWWIALYAHIWTLLVSFYISVCPVEGNQDRSINEEVLLAVYVCTAVPWRTLLILLKTRRFFSDRRSPATGMSSFSCLQQFHREIRGTGHVGDVCWQSIPAWPLFPHAY